jgi:hypothetical protein
MGAPKAASAMASEDRETLVKIAYAVTSLQRSGRAQIKEARPGSPERHERDEIKNYIIEVCRAR